ncbi:tetratricopeptide repeat protein, partial [Actinomadura kijaniata]|uniref:tetratricopeptide repeat protein n=1 Tax=Actinomadura kijaniata TaxID=46161 RepID=UPI003F1BEBEC
CRTCADAVRHLWPAIERDPVTQQLGQTLRTNTTALHQATGTALCNLDDGAHVVLFHAANTLGQTGQVLAARTAYTDLHTTCHLHLGPNHPDTLTARNNLAYWQGEAGDAAGAATASEELLADRLRVLGPDHPDTL